MLIDFAFSQNAVCHMRNVQYSTVEHIERTATQEEMYEYVITHKSMIVSQASANLDFEEMVVESSSNHLAQTRRRSGTNNKRAACVATNTALRNDTRFASETPKLFL